MCKGGPRADIGLSVACVRNLLHEHAVNQKDDRVKRRQEALIVDLNDLRGVRLSHDEPFALVRGSDEPWHQGVRRCMEHHLWHLARLKLVFRVEAKIRREVFWHESRLIHRHLL